MPPKKDVADVAKEIYALLEPLDAAQRARAVRAALTLLGDDFDPYADKNKQSERQENSSGSGSGSGSGRGTLAQNMKAKTWMKAGQLSDGELSHVFHLDNGTVELIASKAPGGKKTIQTINTYVLTGAAAYLQSGDAKFDDAVARAQCERLGCYDRPNHASILKNGKKNLLTGSKNTGWTVTAPGLQAAAALIKELAAE